MTLEYCADAIAVYHTKLVLVERLNTPTGLALPGGRRDMVQGKLETATECAIREFEEETGLTLVVKGELGTYDAPGRDPRGPKSSTVMYGTAQGNIRSEPGKTKVCLIEPSAVRHYRDQFAFDHYQILVDWQAQVFL